MSALAGLAEGEAERGVHDGGDEADGKQRPHVERLDDHAPEERGEHKWERGAIEETDIARAVGLGGNLERIGHVGDDPPASGHTVYEERG